MVCVGSGQEWVGLQELDSVLYNLLRSLNTSQGFIYQEGYLKLLKRVLWTTCSFLLLLYQNLQDPDEGQSLDVVIWIVEIV